MSEYNAKEVNCVMQHFSSVLEVPVASLQMLMVATVTELLGDWQAEWSSAASLISSTTTSATAAELKEVQENVLSPLPPQEPAATISGLRLTTARLELWMCAMLDDLSAASDLYFTDAMVQCLWMAVQQHPEMSCRRAEWLTGCPRTSAESIVIALTLQAFLESRRSSGALFAGMTMNELLGVSIAEETCGGTLVEYVEALLESGL